MADPTSALAAPDAFDTATREAVYRTILTRRDAAAFLYPTRWRPNSQPGAAGGASRALGRLHGPGIFSLRDPGTRRQVHDLFAKANVERR